MIRTLSHYVSISCVGYNVGFSVDWSIRFPSCCLGVHIASCDVQRPFNKINNTHESNGDEPDGMRTITLNLGLDPDTPIRESEKEEICAGCFDHGAVLLSCVSTSLSKCCSFAHCIFSQAVKHSP